MFDPFAETKCGCHDADWRWRAFQDERIAHRHGRQDPWIQAILDQDKPSRLRRGTRRHAVAQAIILRNSLDDLGQGELEGLLLAGEDLECIGTRFGVGPLTVEAYAALYFDVLGRLQASDWILLRAVKLPPQGYMPTLDRVIALRHFGYHGGRFVVDALLDYFHTLGEIIPLNSLENIQRAKGRLRIRIALHLLQTNPDDQGLKKATTMQFILQRFQRQLPEIHEGLGLSFKQMLADVQDDGSLQEACLQEAQYTMAYSSLG